ncbi:hypothetical protein [Ammoniphilus sp. CFH 90114]|uniref:hypothetical protein n=1 Tax=Ammoniphilus sp. CFH 90114 TaxID=2493665 RepID=UPI00102565F7|nr:hypothetical protein [Ammoniphilus sp. CFH 90114]RXT08107.1 hypothetical protein EIZ39_11920 [Ammoniphilus sp. CFH 90114]
MRFFNKVKGTLDIATRKSQDALEINKLNTQIKKLETEAEKLYQSIGEKIFRDPIMEQDETKHHVKAQVHALTHLHRQIDEMKGKVLFLKDLVTCDSCRQIVTISTKFCPDCGNNIAELVKRTMKNLSLEEHNLSNEKDKPLS